MDKAFADEMIGKYQKKFFGFALGKKKLAEIAKILELPEGTVKWHLSDAKTQLKERMGRRYLCSG